MDETVTLGEEQVVRDALGWDVPNWARALAFVEAHLDMARLLGGRGLEVGTGFNGGLTLWLARRGVQMVCSGYHTEFDDVSDTTRRIHSKYALRDVAYARIDATRIPYVERFDVVAMRSVIGGVSRSEEAPAAQEVVSQAWTALRPDGYLVMLENLAATPVHRYFRSRFGSGAFGWQYFTIEEFVGMLGRFRSVSYATTGLLACFGRTESQRTVLGRIDRALDRVVPARWNYIVSIVAQK